MGMRVRSGLLVILVLAPACTGSRQGTSSTRVPDSKAPTASGSPTTTSEPGWLAINVRFDPDAFFFTEGSVSFVDVFDEAGGLVGKTRSKDWRMFFRRQLQPGGYEAKTYRRPCDGSCQALKPPRDVCEFSVEMLEDGANRFIVVRAGRGGKCRVSDKGDVIDFDTDRAVTDHASFTQGLVAAGYELRERPGDRWLGRFFSNRGRSLSIGEEQLRTFEYASRSELKEISISPDGTGISSKDGLAGIIEWTEPHFYRSGRLLVLYLGDTPVVLETLNLVLGPQFAGR